MEFPNSWIEVQLMELLDALETGSRPKGGVQGILEGIPSIGGEHLSSDGGFKFDNIKYVPLMFAASLNRGKIKEHDILIVKDGATTGKTSFVDTNFPYDHAFVNEHVFLCRPSKLINSKCLYYFLRSKTGQDRVMSNFAGAAQGGINTKFSNNTLVSLPPLPEQQRIVAKLDTLFGQLDRIKASMERIPQLLKDFRQKVLTQAVTGKLTEEWREGRELEEWEMKTLEEFVIKIQAGKNFNCPEYPVTEDTVGLVKISAVTWGKFDPNETKTVLDKSKIFPELFIKKGDFLITRANTLELVGACLIVDEVKYKIMLSDKVWRVTFKDDIDQRFVDVFLKSSLGRAEIESRATGNQLSMRNISQDSFRKIDFNYPSIEEQKEIVRRVESLFAKADKIEASYQKLKAKLEQLPQALLAKAFRGELVEQLPTDGDARELLEQIRKLKEEGTRKGKGKKLVAEEEVRMVAEDGAKYGKRYFQP